MSSEYRSNPMHVEASIRIECDPVDVAGLNRVLSCIEEVEQQLRDIALGCGIDVEVEVDVRSQPAELVDLPLIGEEESE